MIKAIKNYIQRWRDYFRMRQIDKITNTLTDNLLEKTKRRVALKKEIHEYISTEFKINPKSKHIPLSLRREIVNGIYAKYRQRMQELNVVVNYNLQFAK